MVYDFEGQLFELGEVLFTPAALDFLASTNTSWTYLLKRHATGDWGDLSKNDEEENNLSVRQGFRILSSYKIGNGKIWLITEADRSATTFLLPDDY